MALRFPRPPTFGEEPATPTASDGGPERARTRVRLARPNHDLSVPPGQLKVARQALFVGFLEFLAKYAGRLGGRDPSWERMVAENV